MDGEVNTQLCFKIDPLSIRTTEKGISILPGHSDPIGREFAQTTNTREKVKVKIER